MYNATLYIAKTLQLCDKLWKFKRFQCGLLGMDYGASLGMFLYLRMCMHLLLICV